MILCEWRNKRRRESVPASCYNRAERFLMDVGGRSGRVIAMCAEHYSIITDGELRRWKEVSQEEYEVFKVHEA